MAMLAKAANTVFRAVVTAACVTYLAGKWQGTTRAHVQNPAEIITGSIERVPVTGPLQNDLLEDKRAGRLPRAPELDHDVFKIILAQSQTRRTNGPSAGKNSGPAVKAPNVDLPPEFDPHFDEWQKNADEKLKDEKAASAPKDHPLAAANPDSYIVICMAGCRPASDLITYKVSKAAASAKVIAERRMQPSSVSVDGKPVAVDPQNGTVCVAGCYDDVEVASATNPKRADVPSVKQPVRSAVRTDRKSPAVERIASRQYAHLVSSETRIRGIAKRLKALAAAKPSKGGSLAQLKKTLPVKKHLAAKPAKNQRVVSQSRIGFKKRSYASRKLKITTEASGFIF